jgi:hypothetical protein
MSTGGGGGGGTNTVTRTELDPIMRPFVQYGLEESTRLYQNPDMPKYYPGQTFVGPSQQTQAALAAAQQRATMGNPLVPAAQQNVLGLQTATNAANPMFASMYQNAQTTPQTAQNVYGGLATGGIQNTASPLYQSLYGNAQTTPQAAQNVFSGLAGGQFGNAAMPLTQSTAQGSFLSGNPFFEGAFRGATQGAQTAYQDATQAALSNASRAGRYGSGSMGTALDRAGGVFANALTNTAGQLAFQNYGAERGMQEAAIGRLAGLSQQDLSNRLTGAQSLAQMGQQTFANQAAAAQGLAGLSAQDISNRMAGAQALSQTGQQTFANQAAAAQAIGAASESDYARRLSAAELAPGLAAADYSDINQLLQTGQAAEGYQEAAMADAVNRFNFAQQAPYMKLQSYLSGAYGAPSGMQQTTPVYRNQMGNVLGGALTGAALGGGTGLGAGVGAAIGGGLGLLG